MHVGPKVHVSCAILLLSLVLLGPASANVVNLNVTALVEYCAYSPCIFSSNSLWIGGVAPSNQDNVVMDLTLLPEKYLKWNFYMGTVSSISVDSLAIRSPRCSAAAYCPQRLLSFTASFGDGLTVASNFTMDGDSVELTIQDRLVAPLAASATETVHLNGKFYVYAYGANIDTLLITKATLSISRANWKIGSLSAMNASISFSYDGEFSNNFYSENSTISIVDVDIDLNVKVQPVVVGGSFIFRSGSAFRYFQGANFTNVHLNYMGIIQASGSSNIYFNNCTGKFAVGLSTGYPANFTVSSGNLELAPSSYSTSDKFNLLIQDGGSVRVSTSYYYCSVFVQSGGTFELSTSSLTYYSLTYLDSTGIFALRDYYASLSLRSISLNNNSFVYTGSYYPGYTRYRTLVNTDYGGNSGRFSGATFTESWLSGTIVTFTYSTYSIQYTMLSQSWPLVGWIAVPLTIVLTIILVAGIVLAARACGRKSGDIDGVDWLGRPARPGYAPVQSQSPILN